MELSLSVVIDAARLEQVDTDLSSRNVLFNSQKRKNEPVTRDVECDKMSLNDFEAQLGKRFRAMM